MGKCVGRLESVDCLLCCSSFAGFTIMEVCVTQGFVILDYSISIVTFFFNYNYTHAHVTSEKLLYQI